MGVRMENVLWTIARRRYSAFPWTLTTILSTHPTRSWTTNSVSSSPHRYGLSSLRWVAGCSTKASMIEETYLRPFSEIPGPRSWPLLGSLPSMATNPAFDANRLPRLMERYFEEYGPIFRIVVPGLGIIVYISNPQDFERLIKETSKNPVRPFFDSLRRVRELNEDNFFQKNCMGIFVENGEEWWRVRSRVQTHIMKPSIVNSYLPRMEEVANEFIVKLADQRDHKRELPEDLLHELFKWALESLCLVVLNRRVGCLDNNEEGQRIIEASVGMLNGISDCEYGFQWWRLFNSPNLRQLKRHHDVLLHVAMKTMIQTKKDLEAREPNDDTKLNFLESLLATPGLSFQDVVIFLVDLLTGGIDTSSLTTVFILYHLAINPEKQSLLQEELDQVLGDGSYPLTPQHLDKLRYTKACIKESLRMCPLTSILNRQTQHDICLNGYSVPQGQPCS
ncbi:probable cytochrome P450 49a1 [Homarus americanus]|uniref:probable cytochrome P450 49a1 n=1 Tax=Homarus americanus TaxID=6706 RepID=UPI001C4900D0|nr:probable cytochrome P450 49a1 [Homarus americanus]XP_042227790.1 probable cytochrome P450 49a1 [Homarus americanus]